MPYIDPDKGSCVDVPVKTGGAHVSRHRLDAERAAAAARRYQPKPMAAPVEAMRWGSTFGTGTDFALLTDGHPRTAGGLGEWTTFPYGPPADGSYGACQLPFGSEGGSLWRDFAFRDDWKTTAAVDWVVLSLFARSKPAGKRIELVVWYRFRGDPAPHNASPQHKFSSGSIALPSEWTLYELSARLPRGDLEFLRGQVYMFDSGPDYFFDLFRFEVGRGSPPH